MANDIAAHPGVKTFSIGEVVVQQGAAAPKEMILVLQGNIGVYKNYKLATQEQIRVIGKGSFHGEFPLFLGHDQTETLVALTSVTVVTINRRSAAEFFSTHPDTAISIAEGLCKQLEEASAELKKLRPSMLSSGPSRRSKLFPPDHGGYNLPLVNNSEYLYEERTTCPLCGQEFESLAIIQSKLRQEKTDADMRIHYVDFEPLYYEVLTCPNCFYSAPASSFSEAPRGFANRINQEVGPYKLDMYIRTGMERDSFTVFAGYYLALLCVPVAFDDYHMLTSYLWLKLSRLYHDCGDDKMHRYAIDKALADFLYAYENLNITEKQFLQICYLIGDIYMKKGDVDKAREFFFTCKTNRSSNKIMKNQADIRLEEIREIKQAERVAELAE